MNSFQTIEMLLERTIKVGDCCYWTGTLLPKGYGLVSCSGIRWYTHRLSYTLAKGPIPANYQVMHSCDNPSCINPSHLSVGTAKDNKQDCAAKGRCHKQGAVSCKNGHQYTDTDWRINPRGSKVRACKACQCAANTNAYKRHKAYFTA